jgi:hypothetical protein
MKVLFSRGNDGKVRFFSAKAVIMEDTREVFVEKTWGILDGAVQKASYPVSSKNVGKRNYTTPFQQAVKEIKSIRQKKMDEGYKTLEDLGIDAESPSWKIQVDLKLPTQQLDGEGRVKPMLLYEARTEHFPKEPSQRKKAKRKDVHYPCQVQPKLDGVCTIATPGNVLSTRGGKDRHTPKGQKWDDIVPHIVSELTFLWKKLKERGIKDYIFHGEIYKHGLTLQEIQKANKKANNDSKTMEFHIFDVVEPEVKQLDRLKMLREVKDLAIAWNLKYVKFITSNTAFDESDIIRLETYWLKHNYEGIIIRHNDGEYKIGGRSKDVLKMVRMDKSEFLVVGVAPLDKDPTMGKFICAFGEKRFYITPGKGYTHEDRRDIILNPHNYINKMIPVIHRGYTDDGLPRIATSPKK